MVLFGGRVGGGRSTGVASTPAAPAPRYVLFEIFGAPDDMKLRSCATLFAHVSAPGSVFETLLDKFFDGEPDQATLQLIDAH